VGYGSSGRVLAYQIQGPEFKLQYCQKKEEVENANGQSTDNLIPHLFNFTTNWGHTNKNNNELFLKRIRTKFDAKL
jgi:hypothetical protein